MLNTIKASVMLLILVMFLPKTSYAWDDQHGRNQGRSHHERWYYAHRNPDLTLVTGMDTIDSGVLIAADDQTPEVVDQPATVVVEQPTVLVDAGTPPVESDTDTITVNVPNKAGGYTPVLLRKWGKAYLGPQGELYYPFPDVSQLKVIYGI